MSATRLEMSGLILIAERFKTASLSSSVIQLIASAAFVQFHLRDSLFTAVGPSKHVGVKKCVVFQIANVSGKVL